MNIFITRPIPGRALTMLQQKGYVVTVPENDKPLPRKKLLKELAKGAYDGVLCLLHDSIDQEIFDLAPSVKIYANFAVGFNNIDVAEAKKRGIVITNTPSDAVNHSVAEHTMALLLSLTHRIVEGDSFVRKGWYKGWNPNLLLGTTLAGKTIGVLGAGRIGTFVIQKAVQGFGMKAVYFDVVRNERAEREYEARNLSSVEEVLKVSDVVTLHVNLTPETTHLINSERLSLMKPASYLINTCRGPVVDEQALSDALKKGTIRAAALDVYEFEPKVVKGLLKLPTTVLTPHIASATDEARDEMSRIAAENLIDFFEGRKPKNSV